MDSFTLEPYARRLDITVQAGDDRSIVVPFGETDPVVVSDLTGFKARAVVRPDRVSSAITHVWSTERGNAQVTSFGIALVNDDSDTWTWERGEYDLVVRDAQDHRFVIAYGFVRVRSLVSRP